MNDVLQKLVYEIESKNSWGKNELKQMILKILITPSFGPASTPPPKPEQDQAGRWVECSKCEHKFFVVGTSP